jgi:VWFA-related protein
MLPQQHTLPLSNPAAIGRYRKIESIKRMKFFPGTRAVFLFCFTAPGACLLNSQTAPPSAPVAEVTTQEAPVIFRSGTNVVPVTVVVRDAKGHPVGNLNVEDFQLFDNGKPQMISRFSVENEPPAAAPADIAKAKPAPAEASALTEASPDGIPDRFVAYLFDDLHASLADLVYTRDAAKRQIDSSLHALDRAAVYTTSGRHMQEFTGDRQKLHAALDSIGAGPATAARALRQTSCPPVDYYMGDRIYNKHDLSVWKIATKDALFCGPVDGVSPSTSVQEGDVSQCEISGSSDGICKSVKLAKESAHAAVMSGDNETEASLEMLRAVVSRMAAMPGQRNIVFISPGFLVLEDRREEQMALSDRAIKAKVVIGGLDARGLYSQIQGGDAGERGNPATITDKVQYQASETLMQSDVVATLADSTGGTFFHGTNDFDDGLNRVAAAPEFRYVLAFSPTDMKLDGRFHTLKVTLKNHPGMELQVRKGYYAPKSSGDPADEARQQIEEAFFSHDEVHDLPAILQTQYFKLESGDVTLSAVAKIDVKKMTFKKEGDRNRNDITVVTGVFDNDGNYINGAQKVVQMRLLNETLDKRVGSGISVKSNFAVHPGRYMVRMVVRDSEGQTMSAQSSLVEIP